MSAQGVGDRRWRKMLVLVVVRINCQHVVGDEQVLLCQLALALKLFEQLFSRIFRLLHVWLVERIDAESPARKGGRNLPQEKLFAQVVKVCQRPVDDWMPRSFERF